MLIKGTTSTASQGIVNVAAQAPNPLSKHSKGGAGDHHHSYNNKANSTVRSVSIDLLDQQQVLK